jgi:CelD/BcsL family acetyltransferase involved in cellulose biosynthesis
MTWQIFPGERFAEHASAWDAVQRATKRIPFLEAAFIAPLLAEFGSGKELLALHVDGSGHDAAAIVRPAGRGMWETFQPSQLPLGPWLAAPHDDLPKRLKSLLRALPGLGVGMGATQLDPLLQPTPAASREVATLDYVRTSYIEIAGTFDAYWESRGKNLRQNTRKQRNKLLTEGLEPALECLTEPGQVADALNDYGVLETAGWKAGTGTAIHPDNAQGRFYRRMLENFCALGRGRIYRYRFGGKVVAMDLCIDNGPVVVILKTAYDESFRAVSPSTLMRFEEFNAWWNEGRYQRIEFYGKTMEWHTRWAEHERQLYHATAFRWPWLRTLIDRVKRRGTDTAAGPSQPPVEAT